MKRLLIVFALVLTVSLPSVAQQTGTPATKEDVQRYLDVMHSRAMLQQMMAAMMEPMHRLVHDQYLKLKEKYNVSPDWETQVNSQVEDLLKSIQWDDYFQAMIPIYQKHYSKEDLEALTAFYQSPTGQKVLREMPAAMAESMDAARPIMNKMMEQMQQRVEQQMAEMTRQLEPLKPSKSPKRN